MPRANSGFTEVRTVAAEWPPAWRYRLRACQGPPDRARRHRHPRNAEARGEKGGGEAGGRARSLSHDPLPRQRTLESAAIGKAEYARHERPLLVTVA
eukprot:312285-Pyramimonas_sp.AAC.1